MARFFAALGDELQRHPGFNQEAFVEVGSDMSIQTAAFRKQIDAAKNGDDEALQFCRVFLRDIAVGDGVPVNVIVELSECLLRLGIDQGKIDAERN